MKPKTISIPGLSVILLSFFFTLNAQDGSGNKPKIWQQEYSAIINGQTVGDAYSGGKSKSAPAFADIDNDGDLDLFVGGDEGNINFYRNDGTPENASWSLITENYDSIDVGWDSSPAFADIDNDGDPDLFIVNGSNKINYYCNDGTPEDAQWTLVSEYYDSIYVGYNCAIAFEDIDNDGDFDLFVGKYDGNISFYRNDGTIENASWNLITENYNSIDVGSYSSPAFADIDNDGDPDLVIAEYDGNINYYRNDGTPENASWTLVTEYFNSIYGESYSKPVFADINNDSYPDFFIGETGGNINFYRNEGFPEDPSWTLITENYNTIEDGYDFAPTFADIDNDGDSDFFIGEYGGTIKFYRNDGTPENASWTLVTEYYGSIEVGYFQCSPVFADIDNDGDLDLFIGEWDGNINFYRNDGTPENASWTLVSEDYNSIDVGRYSSPAFADIDNDNDLDLFIGAEYGEINFYQNNGTPENASWTFVTTEFNLIDVGYYSTPSFADNDNDGDLDLFIGESEGNIYFYRNDGTPEDAIWTFVTDNFNSINVGSDSDPTFADIDNDGDLDLFIGEWDGNINFYRNNGTPENAQWTFVTENFNSINVGTSSFPAFADIDNDGDLDLFVGEYSGNINFYRNDGTPENALWILVTENLNSINVGNWSTPSFTDIDSDGDLDLFIGEQDGNINFYRNDGTPEYASWTFITENYNSIDEFWSIPVFIDIENDGDLDLFIGENYGKINFYRNDGTPENEQWTLVTEYYDSINIGSNCSPAFADIDNDGDPDLFIGEDLGGIYFWRKLDYDIDLELDHFDIPLILTIGDSIKLYNTISNSKSDTAWDFIVNFYLSEDTVITVHDYLIGTRSIDELLPYSDFPDSTIIKIPSDFARGYYYIGTITDVNGNIPETNERNNKKYNSNIIYVSKTGGYNVEPSLYGGKVIPDTGHAETEYIYIVNISDPDDDTPTHVSVKIDNNTIQTMSHMEGDGDYSNSEIYEYRTNLTEGEHIFSFSASDGLANAIGDTYIHTGPVTKMVNSPPVLTNGKVFPETGAPSTVFCFSVIYSDADNDTCSEILITIDDNPPVSMVPVAPEDYDYTDGIIYQYKTCLDTSEHIYSFSASDWSDEASGDISIHSGPDVSLSGLAPVLSNGQVTPQSGVQDTVFTYSVVYTNHDGLPPTLINIKIDDDTFGMDPVGEDINDYINGVKYEYKTTMDTSDHAYSFIAECDGIIAGGDTALHYGPLVSDSSSASFIPSDGKWIGETSQGHPVLFYVSENGSKVVDFHSSIFIDAMFICNYDTNYWGWTLSTEIEEMNISANNFSGSGDGGTQNKFTGTFTSQTSSTGTMKGNDVTMTYCYGFIPILLAGEGTWYASLQSAINIDEPKNNALVNTPLVEVSGTASGILVKTAKINNVDVEINNGSFSTNVTLTEGENNIVLSAYDDNNHLVGTHSIVVYSDNTAPVVTITEPADNLETKSQEINVAGSINDPSVSYIDINNKKVCVVNGQFESLIPLNIGENKITAICYDDAGNMGSDTIRTTLLCMNEYTYLTETICEGESYQFGGSVYAETGVYVDYFESQYGCDSIVTLDLFVKPVDETYLSKTICQGDSVMIGNSAFKTEGNYSVTLPDQYGCDSIVTLDLFINPVDETYLSETICQGDSVVIGSLVFKTAGNYSATLPNRYGCDSIVTLDLFVNPVDETYLSETIYQGDSVVIGSSVFKTAGNYSVTLSNQFGCDSIVTLDLFVNPIVNPPSTPNLYSPYNGEEAQSRTPELAWSYTSNTDAYHLQVAKDSIFTELVLNDSTITETLQTIGPLESMTTYYWRVRAQNTGGYSPYSEVYCFTTENPDLFYQAGHCVYSLYFADDNTGWAAGFDGIIKTTNGGITWESEYETTVTLKDIFFINSSVGWTVGDNGTIIKTIDGGDNWVLQNSGTTYDLESVFFIDLNTGFVVGDNGIILKTTDGGTFWIKQNSNELYTLKTVYFIDENVGWAAGINILQTNDGGNNWTNCAPEWGGIINSSFFIDDKEGWLVGFDGEILKTNDGGTTWANQNSGTTENLNDIFFYDKYLGWAVGNEGTVIKTADGGVNWVSLESGYTDILKGVYFVNQDTGWVGGICAIYKSETGIGDIQSLSIPQLISPINNSLDVPLYISLKWESVENAESYCLQVSDNDDFISPVYNESGIDTTSQQVNGLDYNTTYYWRVNAAKGTSMISPWSETWNFTTINSVGINETGYDIQYKLYPNPVKDKLFIEGFEDELTSISILSLDGKLLKQIKEKGMIQIYVRDLQNGIYLVKISNSKTTVTERIVKQ